MIAPELLEKAKELTRMDSFTIRSREQETYQLYREIFEMEPCEGCGARRLSNTLNSLRDLLKRQDEQIQMAKVSTKYRFKGEYARTSVVLPEEGRVISAKSLTDEDAKFLQKQDQYKHLIEPIPSDDSETADTGGTPEQEQIAALRIRVAELETELASRPPVAPAQEVEGSFAAKPAGNPDQSAGDLAAQTEGTDAPAEVSDTTAQEGEAEQPAAKSKKSK